MEQEWIDDPYTWISEMYWATNSQSNQYFNGIFIDNSDKSYEIKFYRKGMIRGAKINGEIALVIRSPYFCPSVIYGETDEENKKRREEGLGFDEAAEFEKKYKPQYVSDYCGSACIKLI